MYKNSFEYSGYFCGVVAAGYVDSRGVACASLQRNSGVVEAMCGDEDGFDASHDAFDGVSIYDGVCDFSTPEDDMPRGALGNGDRGDYGPWDGFWKLLRHADSREFGVGLVFRGNCAIRGSRVDSRSFN